MKTGDLLWKLLEQKKWSLVKRRKTNKKMSSLNSKIN